MFGTIRKHQTWLWAVIITLTIISFVWYFTPNGKSGGKAQPTTYGTIDGREITREQYAHAYREVAIIIRLNTGAWPGGAGSRVNDQEVQREAQLRLWLNQKIDDLNLEVSDAVAAEWITSSSLFRDRQTGQFSKAAYDNFVKTVLKEGRLTEADFAGFVKHEIGRQQLVSTFGMAGKLVSPAEAEALFREENEQFVTELVSFTAFDFVGKVNTAQTNLAKFFNDNLARYRLPDRVTVEYVKFEFTNFLAAADAELAKRTNLAQIVDSFYEQRGAKSFTDTNNQPLPPAAAKEKIKQQFREELSQAEARKAAATLTDELDAIKPVKPANFATLTAAKGLKVGESKAFSEFEPPSDLEVMGDFSKQAFSINDDEPFRGPIIGMDAAYVITVKRRLPSEVPKMESVLQKVMDDFRQVESMRLAREAGQAFEKTLKAGMTAKKEFAAICREAKVTPVSVPSFSISTQQLPEVERIASLNQLQMVASSLNAGAASDLTPTRDGAFVLYLAARKPADEAKVKSELPAFLTELRQGRQGMAFQEWVRQASAGLRVGAAN